MADPLLNHSPAGRTSHARIHRPPLRPLRRDGVPLRPRRAGAARVLSHGDPGGTAGGGAGTAAGGKLRGRYAQGRPGVRKSHRKTGTHQSRRAVSAGRRSARLAEPRRDGELPARAGSPDRRPVGFSRDRGGLRGRELAPGRGRSDCRYRRARGDRHSWRDTWSSPARATRIRRW